MKALFKLLAFVLMLMFVYAAYVQGNDPDPLKWYLMYGFAAFASLLFLFGRFRPIMGLIAFIFFAYTTYNNWPADFEGVGGVDGDFLKMGTDNINVEMGREALGTAIAAVAMLLYALGAWITGPKED